MKKNVWLNNNDRDSFYSTKHNKWVHMVKLQQASLLSPADCPTVVDSDDSSHTLPGLPAGGKNTDSLAPSEAPLLPLPSRLPSVAVEPDDEANLGELCKH